MNPTDTLLKERERTHGNFTDHARITQRLKDVIVNELMHRRERKQPELDYVMLESLDMIAHKIGRVIAGDATAPDHWDDMAGYARLVSVRNPPQLGMATKPGSSAIPDSKIDTAVESLKWEHLEPV